MHQNFLDQFKKNYPDREILFLCTAGSHFFNLNGPNSDHDYRGVYLPSPKEYYDGENKRKMVEYKTQDGCKANVKNGKDDIDFTMFSITKFLELLASGDFNVIEMLSAPADKIIIDSPLMQELRMIRKSIIVNDISAFLGFIKKEYNRYNVNAHHHEIQEKFLNFLQPFHEHRTLKDIWVMIEEYAKNDPFISFTESQTGKGQYVPSIKIAQRLYQDTVKVEYVRQSITQRLETYGHRQRSMAAANVEFKGLYHVQRLIYEANDLFDDGELTFPLSKERHDYLLSIKNGTIEQDTLFGNIDNDIEELYKREKDITTNRSQVHYMIDKIKFHIDGRQKIAYLNKNMVL